MAMGSNFGGTVRGGAGYSNESLETKVGIDNKKVASLNEKGTMGVAGVAIVINPKKNIPLQPKHPSLRTQKLPTDSKISSSKINRLLVSSHQLDVKFNFSSGIDPVPKEKRRLIRLESIPERGGSVEAWENFPYMKYFFNGICEKKEDGSEVFKQDHEVVKQLWEMYKEKKMISGVLYDLEFSLKDSDSGNGCDLYVSIKNSKYSEAKTPQLEVYSDYFKGGSLGWGNVEDKNVEFDIGDWGVIGGFRLATLDDMNAYKGIVDRLVELQRKYDVGVFTALIKFRKEIPLSQEVSNFSSFRYVFQKEIDMSCLSFSRSISDQNDSPVYLEYQIPVKKIDESNLLDDMIDDKKEYPATLKKLVRTQSNSRLTNDEVNNRLIWHGTNQVLEAILKEVSSDFGLKSSVLGEGISQRVYDHKLFPGLVVKMIKNGMPQQKAVITLNSIRVSMSLIKEAFETKVDVDGVGKLMSVKLSPVIYSMFKISGAKVAGAKVAEGGTEDLFICAGVQKKYKKENMVSEILANSDNSVEYKTEIIRSIIKCVMQCKAFNEKSAVAGDRPILTCMVDPNPENFVLVKEDGEEVLHCIDASPPFFTCDGEIAPGTEFVTTKYPSLRDVRIKKISTCFCTSLLHSYTMTRRLFEEFNGQKESLESTHVKSINNDKCCKSMKQVVGIFSTELAKVAEFTNWLCLHFLGTSDAKECKNALHSKEEELAELVNEKFIAFMKSDSLITYMGRHSDLNIRDGSRVLDFVSGRDLKFLKEIGGQCQDTELARDSFDLGGAAKINKRLSVFNRDEMDCYLRSVCGFKYKLISKESLLEKGNIQSVVGCWLKNSYHKISSDDKCASTDISVRYSEVLKKILSQGDCGKVFTVPVLLRVLRELTGDRIELTVIEPFPKEGSKIRLVSYSYEPKKNSTGEDVRNIVIAESYPEFDDELFSHLQDKSSLLLFNHVVPDQYFNEDLELFVWSCFSIDGCSEIPQPVCNNLKNLVSVGKSSIEDLMVCEKIFCALNQLTCLRVGAEVEKVQEAFLKKIARFLPDECMCQSKEFPQLYNADFSGLSTTLYPVEKLLNGYISYLLSISKGGAAILNSETNAPKTIFILMHSVISSHYTLWQFETIRSEEWGRDACLYFRDNYSITEITKLFSEEGKDSDYIFLGGLYGFCSGDYAQVSDLTVICKSGSYNDLLDSIPHVER
ncbi:hypothetical protein [uncultured Endozoicomonas sp.]|uniref:hypothetical protein n=1 Tax=uncultured Endozoicomonas sp. TaxID=432652 RepID=UPI002615E5B1|nr:hypothetical protein [uncultured Endozoicomonas sp.]